MSINTISNITGTNNGVATARAASKSTSSDFKSYLGESQNLDAIFQKAADKYGVDVKLLKAIGKTESNFNPNAVSRAGAQGVMQLMPATAKGLGVTNSFDPEQNIMGAAKLMASHLKKYNGDVTLSLAAYNAGGGNVSKYGGVPPFKETQNYIVKVMKAYNGSSTLNVSASSTNETKAEAPEFYPGQVEESIDYDSIGKSLEQARRELQTSAQTAYEQLSQSTYQTAMKSLMNEI